MNDNPEFWAHKSVWAASFHTSTFEGNILFFLQMTLRSFQPFLVDQQININPLCPVSSRTNPRTWQKGSDNFIGGH